jgi:hypothetical protein
MTETEELLKLSVIYVNLLRDLEELTGCKFESIHRATQIVSDAVDEACAVRNPPYIDDSDRGWSLTP